MLLPPPTTLDTPQRLRLQQSLKPAINPICCRAAFATLTARATDAATSGALSGPHAAMGSRTAPSRMSTAGASAPAACAVAGVSHWGGYPRREGHPLGSGLPWCRAQRTPAEPPSPALQTRRAQSTPTAHRGVQSCVEKRCAEAKYCASRLFYDEFGTDLQLRTFGGKPAALGHGQQPIKCGQCVCKDCPVRPRLRSWGCGAGPGAGRPVL